MSVFVKAEEYSVAVNDPETKEVAGNVKLRVLNAGDRANLEDSVRMSGGSDNVEVRIGTLRMLTVQAAIVDWDFEGAPSPTAASIATLHPDVFEQIYEAVSFGARESAPLETES